VVSKGEADDAGTPFNEDSILLLLLLSLSFSTFALALRWLGADAGVRPDFGWFLRKFTFFLLLLRRSRFELERFIFPFRVADDRRCVAVGVVDFMALREEGLLLNFLGFLLVSRMSGSRVVAPPVEASFTPPGDGTLGGIFIG
jgi:hypothetical protein